MNDPAFERGFLWPECGSTSHILTSVGHGDPRSIASSTQLGKRLKWEDMVHIKDKE